MHNHRHYLTVPNALTGLRLLLVPILWLCALLGLTKLVAIGLLVAAVTDILDGRLARTLGQTSRFGSQLDSVADTAMAFSAAGWLLMFKPNVVVDHPILFTTLLLAAVTSLWIGWARFRRLADLHLATGRAAGVAGYAFLIHLFFADDYLEPLFYVVMALAFIVAAEALVIQITRNSLDERVASPLLARFSSVGRSDPGGPGAAP